MVSETYHIVIVGEGDYPLGVRLGHGEQMLEDIFNSLSQWGVEVVENQMGVYLRHILHFLLYVVTQHYVLQPKV